MQASVLGIVRLLPEMNTFEFVTAELVVVPVTGT